MKKFVKACVLVSAMFAVSPVFADSKEYVSAPIKIMKTVQESDQSKWPVHISSKSEEKMLNVTEATKKATKVEYMIVEAAEDHGVDPKLALAIAKVESGFNCKARGSSGEQGVMQVLPRTAKGVGVKGNLYDCKTGIEAGMRYLKQAIDRHGEGCSGISAYNMGIHRDSVACTKYGKKILSTMNKM